MKLCTRKAEVVMKEAAVVNEVERHAAGTRCFKDAKAGCGGHEETGSKFR